VLHHAAGLTGADISKECGAFIFRDGVMEEYCISKDFTPLKTKAIGSFRMLRSVNRATQCNISKEQNSQHGKNSYDISFSATYSTKLAKGMLHNATHKTSNGILYSLFKLTTACSSI
jgi:hypothetical protein